MRWKWKKPSLPASLYALLGQTPPEPSTSILETGTEDVRDSMLATLGDQGWRRFPQVTRRIRYAGDIQALWYLRSELMGALAQLHGEAVARDKLASLTTQFRRLLPAGLTSRPSPLVG